MNPKMKALSCLFFGVIVFFALSACSESEAGTENDVEEEKIIIQFSHGNADDSVKGEAANHFAELVEKKTDGAVEVEVYPAGMLYSDNEELEALMSGNVQMIAPALAKLVKLDPYWQITDLPFLFKDEDHVLNFFQSDFAKEMMNSEELAQNDIKGLAFWQNGFKQFTNSKRPLITPSDFKDLKFRTQAGRLIESQFNALEAGNATIVLAETYTALQQGTVDGQENTFDNIYTTKIHEPQDYMTVSDHARLDYGIFVNKSFWDGIPKELRVLVEEALEEATERQWQQAKEQNLASYEKIKDSGEVEIVELTEEQRSELEEAMQPVYEEYSDLFKPEDIEEIKSLE